MKRWGVMMGYGLIAQFGCGLIFHGPGWANYLAFLAGTLIGAEALRDG